MNDDQRERLTAYASRLRAGESPGDRLLAMDIESAVAAACGVDREVLVDILVHHYRDGIKGCGCGWSELGRSWPEHVANMYEQALSDRSRT